MHSRYGTVGGKGSRFFERALGVEEARLEPHAARVYLLLQNLVECVREDGRCGGGGDLLAGVAEMSMRTRGFLDLCRCVTRYCTGCCEQVIN